MAFCGNTWSLNICKPGFLTRPCATGATSKATKWISSCRIGRDEVDAIECKWNSDAFDSTALKIFRQFHPKGRNFLVTPSGTPAYIKRFGELESKVCTPSDLCPPQE